MAYHLKRIKILNTDLTIENERRLVRRLLDLVADRARREQEIESTYTGEISDEQQQYQQVHQLLTETYETEFAANQQKFSDEQAAIEEKWATEQQQVQSKYEETLATIDERWQVETTAAQKEHDEAGWLLGSLLEPMASRVSDRPRFQVRLLSSVDQRYSPDTVCEL